MLEARDAFSSLILIMRASIIQDHASYLPVRCTQTGDSTYTFELSVPSHAHFV